MDADGHVEEWEATFSDKYLEPAFRDRRPQIVDWDAGDFDVDFAWLIEGKKVRLGGSPSSRDGVLCTEYERMRPWRGPHESAEFHSAAARLAVMDEEDTWLSVNFPTLMLLWPLAKDPLLNQALTRSYNNWIADVSSESPDRLKWIAMIDPSDPAEAAREVERCKEMGSVGICAFGNYEGMGLDHPDFHPIWKTAEDTGMTVNVHPGLAALSAMKDYPAVADDQFLTSVVRGFKTVMTSGLLDKYPKVTVSFQETGCTWVDFAVEDLSFMLDNIQDRIKMNALRVEHKAILERGLPEMTPLEYIKAGRVFLGFEVDDELLPYMVKKYGVECWTYASDIPHTHRKPYSARMLLARPDLAEDDKRRMLFEGTSNLYGLPVPARVGAES
jgi:predicted TIM-barrel fold metal-dependent hydrolase